MTDTFDAVLAADLAQEIRRVDGSHSLGAGALAEALLPFLSQRFAAAHAAEVAERDARIERLFAANEQVMARAEAAERDAGRYRWLRPRLDAEELHSETAARMALNIVGPIGARPEDDDYDGELDAAIDAAIATTEQADA